MSPASRVAAGVTLANATATLEISIAGVASAAAGDSLASLAADAASNKTRGAFFSRANETGYAVVESNAVGSVTATDVRVTLVTMTQSDASSATAALDFGVSAMTQKIGGTIDVGPESVRLEVKLPFLLALFAEKIQKVASKEGNLLLTKK